MKYFILISDGMADFPIKSLGNKSPMEAAEKNEMDRLAKSSLCGTVSNVPDGMIPESDTANLAILSYDPKIYSKGRSPLEAVSMGITLDEDDTAIRCNFVTLSAFENYENKIMLDHSADEITTEEADELVKALNEKLCSGENSKKKLYTGVSYRHCLVWKGLDIPESFVFMRPHDILGQSISEYLPCRDFLHRDFPHRNFLYGKNGEIFYEFMRDSFEILKDHPVNLNRERKGLRPANSAWLWSPGKKPSLPSFSEKWNIRASVISAVDLIKGIGYCAGMDVIDVEGATGNIHTNYKGKADAAINAFKNGSDLVYVHVEAPDECGHRGEVENKVKSIEYIDKMVLLPVSEYLKGCGDEYKIMVLPDHPTPVSTRTHSSDPVPFFIYSSAQETKGVKKFTESECEKTDFYIKDGSILLDYLINTDMF